MNSGNFQEDWLIFVKDVENENEKKNRITCVKSKLVMIHGVISLSNQFSLYIHVYVEGSHRYTRY